MITTAITAAIVAALAFFGIAPSPWLVGAIWIAVKAMVVLGALALAARTMRRSKAASGDS